MEAGQKETTCEVTEEQQIAEEQEPVVTEEATETEDGRKEKDTSDSLEKIKGSEDEVTRTEDQKTNNEGDIKSEEDQIPPNIKNTENKEQEERMANTQPAGGDIEGETEENQQSKKVTDTTGLTEGAQADRTKTINSARTSNKENTPKKKSSEHGTDLPRSTTRPKCPGRTTKKDIAEKFGGTAPCIRVQRPTSQGANTVKNMLLDWCRAKTRGREGVDVQNFSSSWSDGLAFCALILAFFPDAFDYDSLDNKNRRQNFQLAFSTAEKMADCPPLLDIEDMLKMKVPDSKCVYTYIQELYRSLVAKGLVKTKKA